MKKIFYPLLLLLFPSALLAQFTGPLDAEFRSISQNSVSSMEANGDTLWISPRLNFNINNGAEWLIPQQADSVINGRGRVFSLAISADTVIAGLGYNDMNAAGNPQTQMGIYFSTDGGQTFVLRGTDRTLDQLDDDNTVLFDDNGRQRTLMRLTYGGREVLASPITVPQQSPPFETDFKGDVVFFAGWASGIRRSVDFGVTWERLLLPPTELNELRPEEEYNFIFDPVTPASGSINSQIIPQGWRNFVAFSVYVDRLNNLVYAGTAAGLNVSDNALTAPADSVRWRRIGYQQGRRDGLLGDWIITIRQNPSNGELWLTNQVVLSNRGERNGLVSTTDGGQTFRQHLPDERINDVQFDGETIYAAGDNGLFISHNNGETWRQIRQIRSPNTFIRSGARYFSLAKTTNRIWVGTNDGIASSTDRGETWQITRTNMPLQGGNQFQENAPSVSSYAYPNPFSPRVHEIIRIRFRAETGSQATVRLFDYGMNLITTLQSPVLTSEGEYEVVWNGRDRFGRQTANGPVFYQITGTGTVTDGKFLILE